MPPYLRTLVAAGAAALLLSAPQTAAAAGAELGQPLPRAHAEGHRVRFWATNDIAGPARENLWTELRAAGVDHINTDDLAGLQEFLSGSAG